LHSALLVGSKKAHYGFYRQLREDNRQQSRSGAASCGKTFKVVKTAVEQVP
jgi:hypothetical protein